MPQDKRQKTIKANSSQSHSDDFDKGTDTLLGIGKQTGRRIGSTPFTQQSRTKTTIATSGNRGSGVLPMLLGILGISIGTISIWIAFDTRNQIGNLEQQLQALKSQNSHQAHTVTAFQKRLTKSRYQISSKPVTPAPQANPAPPEDDMSGFNEPDELPISETDDIPFYC